MSGIPSHIATVVEGDQVALKFNAEVSEETTAFCADVVESFTGFLNMNGHAGCGSGSHKQISGYPKPEGTGS